MSSNNSLSYKRAARILTVACGLLFSIFSIVYLFVLQKDVVGALHYSLSQGKTHYSPLVGAIIITVVLLVFRWGINGLMGLKGPVRTLSYFPSCLLLGVLTDVDRTIFHGGNMVFANLPILFAMGVAIGMARREKEVAALAAAVAFAYIYRCGLYFTACVSFLAESRGVHIGLNKL